MRSLFDYDGPVLRFFSKLADLVILNFLTMIFCIPIFTIGPALTAAHYAALKLHRGESYVFRNYWKSFKENFKQSIAIGFIFAIFLVIAGSGLLIMYGSTGTFNAIVQGVILMSLIFAIIVLLWVYPVQSRFVNTVGATIRNAFILGFKHIFRSLYMIMLYLLPVVLTLVSFRLFSIVILFGMSVPIYLSALTYNKIFEKLEDMILGKNEEDNQSEDENWEGAEPVLEEQSVYRLEEQVETGAPEEAFEEE